MLVYQRVEIGGDPIFRPAQVRTSRADPWLLPLSEFELGSEEIRRNGAWQPMTLGKRLR